MLVSGIYVGIQYVITLLSQSTVPLPKHIRILADANKNVILKDSLINQWCFNPWHCFTYVSNCCYHSRWRSVIDILGNTSHIVKPPTKSVKTAISLTEGPCIFQKVSTLHHIKTRYSHGGSLIHKNICWYGKKNK